MSMHILAGMAAMLWVAASFLGFGSVLNALLYDGRLTVAQCAATGVAIYLAVCGLLEATATASPLAEYALGSVGVIGAYFCLRRRPLRGAIRRLIEELKCSGRWVVWGGVAVLACYALFVLNSAYWDCWNMDDLRGYLVLPLRVLQEGSASQDPFIYRRIEAGLGGSNYLYAAFLAYADFTAAKLMDLGFGTALLAVLIVENRPKRISVLLLTLAWTLFLLATAPSFNLSPDIIATALAVSLATILFGGRTEGIGLISRGVVIGLHVFAIVCLKTTYGLAAAAVFLAGYGSEVLAGKAKLAVAEGGIAAVVCALLMIPWMYATYKVSGTPFFPILGSGYAVTTEFSNFADTRILVKTYLRWAFCISLPLALAIAIWRNSSQPSLRRNALLIAVITIGLMACAIPKITIMALRYLFPTLLLLNLLILLFFARSDLAWRRSFFAVMLVSAIGMTHGYGNHRLPTLYYGWLFEPLARTIGFNAGPNLVALTYDTHYSRDREPLTAGIAKLQSSIAPGAAALAFVDAPIFLDYRRNKINTMDWPGVISPPPGLPESDEPKHWLAYLRARHIRYVLVARERAMGLEPLSYSSRGDLLGRSPWQDLIFRQFFRVRDILESMRSVCVIVFEDDRQMALDCATPGDS
jgi:hypothetical protein